MAHKGIRSASAQGVRPPADATLAGRLAGALLDAPVGVLLVSKQGRIELANLRIERILGIGALAGRDIGVCAPRLALPDAGEAPERRGRGGLPVAWTQQPDGSWLGLLAEPRRARRRALPRPLAFDPLTGLASATGLVETLDEMFRSLDEPGQDTAILYFDLDHFQRAAEMLGAAATQTLIQRVAGRLRGSIRTSDIAARLGDDEFAIALQTESGRTGPDDLARRIQEILSHPFLIDGQSVTVSASFGLALRGQSAGSGEDLLRLAKIAMEHGRRSGRSRIEWYEASLGEAIRERHAIETGLRRAVLLEEFEVHYQPQFTLSGQSIAGFEALVRWRHPERGLVSPSVFIPVAEDLGLLPQLGAWVLQTACQAATGWEGDLTVAVNVAAVQFEMPGFVEMVIATLALTGLDPRRLELELTESALLRHTPQTVARMDALRAHGVRLALDDFGTGYASLNYLRQFPFDKIKMDQSFVRGPSADETSMRIIATIAQLGEAFGMTVLAEGVETEGQLSSIRARGCDAVQGYLFGRPMPEAQVLQFLGGLAGGGAEP